MSLSTWDVVRAHERGDHGAVVPTCSRCDEISVLDPCRSCATPVELARYPVLPGSRAARDVDAVRGASARTADEVARR